ncbi:MAG: hypothetical protein FJY82_13490 [Candidatus Aminicenantes bacterium]|nr:hypothetical protein [Candidatus Aminicenantes bacterium]
MDLLRLQKALLICRMAADSTYLVDKIAPGHSTKLAELDILLDHLLAEEERKILLFSEWTTMLDLIEPKLRKNGAKYVRLDGSIPQRKRPAIMRRFTDDGDCRLFLTTNAGLVGLNLQAADTVINVDLPWNPAVLEQRISRAHRMGQKRPVSIFLLVTEDTIEESMLGTLSAKHDLAMAALDFESDVTNIAMAGGIEELRRRVERLMATPDEDDAERGPGPGREREEGGDGRGATAEEKAPPTEGKTGFAPRPEEKPGVQPGISGGAIAGSPHAYGQAGMREGPTGGGMAEAGGRLLGAMFAFIGEMFGAEEKKDEPTRDEAAEAVKKVSVRPTHLPSKGIG